MMSAKRLCLAAACATLVAAGCSRGGDPSAQAEQALKDANLSNLSVDWDDDARLAYLQGTVDTPADRDRAEQVASTAVGTSGRVLNEVTIRGMNDDNADDLDRDIRSALSGMIDADPALKDRDIDVRVKNGVVTIKGSVQSAAEKGKVTEMVRSAPGVKDFANALQINR